jgi:hypothetical protein
MLETNQLAIAGQEIKQVITIVILPSHRQNRHSLNGVSPLRGASPHTP